MDMWGNKYTVNQESFLNTNKPTPAQISIYTDGSKTEDHVGTGYVIYKQGAEIHTNSTRLPNKNTVYQAEVLAIKLAVHKLLEIKVEKDRFVKNFSDSQAALKALNSWKKNSKLVANTIASLNKLGEKLDRLELNWVKAHNNYTGNERADEMARNAVYNNIVFFGLDPPHSYFQKQLWNAIYELWNERWSKDKTCGMTKIFYPRTHKGKSKALLNMSRKKSRRIIEIVTFSQNYTKICSFLGKT